MLNGSKYLLTESGEWVAVCLPQHLFFELLQVSSYRLQGKIYSNM